MAKTKKAITATPRAWLKWVNAWKEVEMGLVV
jgi:hypothetical protein